MNDELNFLSEIVELIEPVGSRVTCNPPPTDTDEDYLVTIRFSYGTFYREVQRNGWTTTTDLNYRRADGKDPLYGFTSWRKGNINLIVTKDTAFASKFRLATHVCKKLNVMNKDDRITVFQAILYENQQ